MSDDDRRLTPGEQLVLLQTESNKILDRGVRALEHLCELVEKTLPPDVATDDELDSPKGNPEVKFSQAFRGAVYKGNKFSECPPAYLDNLARTFDYYYKQKRYTDPKEAGYDARSARLARGWAARIRAHESTPRPDERSSDDSKGIDWT